MVGPQRTPEVKSAVRLFVGWAPWLTVFLLLAYSGVRHWIAERRDEDRANQQRAAEDQRAKQSIAEFGARYDAVELAPRLASSDWSSPKYSLELQSILVPGHSRPVLLVGEVHDIALDSAGNPLCIFDILYLRRWGLIKFALHCNLQQANSLRAAHPSPTRRFAVIAQVMSVRKSDGADKEDGGDQSSGADFLAEGNLLDSMFVGRYYGDLREIYSSRGAKP